MQHVHYLSEEEATWLRTLERRNHEGSSDSLDIPDDVLNVLIERRLVRRWSDGNVEITLGGIREVAQL
jgi:hypothetical protein